MGFKNDAIDISYLSHDISIFSFYTHHTHVKSPPKNLPPGPTTSQGRCGYGRRGLGTVAARKGAWLLAQRGKWDGSVLNRSDFVHRLVESA